MLRSDVDDTFASDPGNDAGGHVWCMHCAVLGPEHVCGSCGDNLSTFVENNRFVEVATSRFFPRKNLIEVIQTFDAGQR